MYKSDFSCFVLIESGVRLVTLELSIKLVHCMALTRDQSFLNDRHFAVVEGAREEATLLLRNYYKVWAKVKDPSYFMSHN